MRFLPGLMFVACATCVFAQAEDPPEVLRAKAGIERLRSLVDAGVAPRVLLVQAETAIADAEDEALQRSVTSKEDFYRGLEQVAEIAPVNAQTLARVSQLTQKTNQFNLTTRRYTEQQISEMAASPDWRVWSLRVKDRYADNGVVGVAIASVEGEVCQIDSFLMSCRVIGRTLETALLARLASDAREQGATLLEGWFLPTKKNAPALEFYREHGFEVAERTGEGVLWRLDLQEKEIRTPEWIKVV